MLISSKRYPEEFKIEAVKQVTEKGHSVAEVAARLGTTTHSLYVWMALLHKHSKAEFSPIHSNLRHNLGARST